MQITNVNSLPEPLVRAVTRPSKERVPKRISLTELTLPPQVRALSIKHESELVEDASDRIWALLGTLLHGNLEGHVDASQGEVAEEKLELSVLGWTVVGKYDLSETILDGELLTDYKLTSIWAVKDGVKREWEEQLNIYAHLIRHAGRHVDQIQIVAIARDWSKTKALYEKDYPKRQVRVFAVPLWTPDETQEFIEQRVRLHEAAENGTWPECTEEERWARPTQYALMKQGQKRAVKLYDTHKAAEDHRGRGQYIQERPGESMRCRFYCAASRFCPQWQRIQETIKPTEGETK